MSNEFESFQTVPELTLEPFAEEKAVEVKNRNRFLMTVFCQKRKEG